MKKKDLSGIVLDTLMMFLFSGVVFAAGDAGKNFTSNKVGVGYQGMVARDFLNGISVRGWIGDRIGLEGSGLYGRVSGDFESFVNGEVKADLWLVEAKAMYALMVRDYSKFYAGGKLGYGRLGFTQANLPSSIKIDGTSVWTPGLFVGAEWSFPQIPEVGFNFDVGYSWFLYENKVSDDPYVYLNLNLSGVSTTFGIHYYF